MTEEQANPFENGIDTEKYDIIYAAEFDGHSEGKRVVRLIQEADNGDIMLLSGAGESTEDHQTIVAAAYRDQWGTFTSVGNTSVAQEDDTRSMLDAIINGLELMRRLTEITDDATVILDETQEEEEETDDDAA